MFVKTLASEVCDGGHDSGPDLPGVGRGDCKGRVPTGSVGVSVPDASPRSARSEKCVWSSNAVAATKKKLTFNLTRHRSWSVFNSPYWSMHSLLFLFIIVGGYNSPVPVRCATKFAQFAWAWEYGETPPTPLSNQSA